MASGLRFTSVRAISSGVAATMTGRDVGSWVEGQAERLAASANAQAAGRRDAIPGRVKALLRHRAHESGGPEPFDLPPYEAHVYAGRADTLGFVDAVTIEGGYDQNQNHTLDSLNH